MYFSTELIRWYGENKRELPWRNSRDPYVIWLSEIILQQTRVQQGLPYFQRFLESYPSVTDFAGAPEEEILRNWQGLGYYSRGRNMLKTAKIVMAEHRGEFPSDYDTLLKLPGIGVYTASAISSFSANQAKAVVDGNVYRVLARHFGIENAINSPKGAQIFQKIAAEVLSKEHPARHNQAIMEFGALQCKPKSPDCGSCPLQLTCFAFNNQAVNRLPVKTKASKSKDRYFSYFIVRGEDGVLMQQRKTGDIWENLYEFPLIEGKSIPVEKDILASAEFQKNFGKNTIIVYGSSLIKHVLSHQNIHARFFEIEQFNSAILKNPALNYVLIKDLDKLAKPKLMYSFIEQYFI